jgi:Linalool dehydratase/isomerase
MSLASPESRTASVPPARLPFAALPRPETVTGPRTRAVMKRSGVLLGALWLAALVVEIADFSPKLTAFALGLLLPGGGLLYAGAWGLFAIALVAFLVSLLIFFVMSPYWVPPLVLLAAAVCAVLALGSSHVDGARVIVPLIVAGLAGVAAASRPVQLRRFRDEVDARNALLAERTWVEPRAASDLRPEEITAHSDDDLAAMRRGFDLLLQPLDRFDGFLTIDQYREAAWRYQMNFVAWYMSLSRLTRTPAFSGYLVEAQRNGVEKTLDPRVWRYWRWEHLLGSLKWDPDPIANDNIMLSGYFAAQVGAYETASGDHRFSAPGALTFDDGKHRYIYSYESICAAVRDNMRTGPLCMFPCEPNWVYPQCNAVGMTGILFHDQIHGTDLAGSVWEEFESALLQDLSRPDDRVVTIKSNRYGVSIPTMEVGVMSDAGSGLWYSPLVPELAARRWEVTRENHLKLQSDGSLELVDIGRLDRVDIGSYNLDSKAFAYGTVMAAAQEMGDAEMFEAALISLEREHPPKVINGARHLEGVSPMAQGLITMGRMMRHHAWHDLIRHGLPAGVLESPTLAEAPYPDVLVARAVSDGRDLDLELVPGDGPGRVNLRLANLAPGQAYVVAGAAQERIEASDDGSAMLTVDLDERRRVRLAPAF